MEQFAQYFNRQYAIFSKICVSNIIDLYVTELMKPGQFTNIDLFIDYITTIKPLHVYTQLLITNHYIRPSEFEVDKARQIFNKYVDASIYMLNSQYDNYGFHELNMNDIGTKKIINDIEFHVYAKCVNNLLYELIYTKLAAIMNVRARTIMKLYNPMYCIMSIQLYDYIRRLTVMNYRKQLILSISKYILKCDIPIFYLNNLPSNWLKLNLRNIKCHCKKCDNCENNIRMLLQKEYHYKCVFVPKYVLSENNIEYV